MKISDATLDQVKQQADILDIIGEYVQLKKAGSRYVGLCPFHEDKKTPSFSVQPNMGVYHCFGCKKSGNVFTFLKDYLGLSFTESVEYLAKKYNIEIKSSHSSHEKDTHSEKVFKALTYVAELYYKNLYSPDGKTALDYFRKRDFAAETIKTFVLGYSPDSFEATKTELHKAGFTEEVIIDTGLLVVRDDGKKYDRFRGRAMFAIRDFLGRVIGFGARQIKDEPDQPKYINSPQSLVYDKSKVLYGIFEAKNAIRNEKSAIIVEGYADLISLHQAGIRNVVASSGTALTKQQLELLSRYTKLIYLIFDADQAGSKATDRAIELALENGFDTRIVTLPAGEDPDSIIRNHGKQVFEAKVKDSKGFLEYLAVKMLAANPDSPQAKAAIARYLLALITKVKDRLQHDYMISELGSLLDMTESQIKIIYSEKSTLEKTPYESFNEGVDSSYFKDREKAAEPVEDFSDENVDDILIDLNELLPEERLLLKIALTLPKYFSLILEMNVNESTFISETGQMLFSIIIEYADEMNIVQKLIESEAVSQKVVQSLVDILVSGESPSDNWKQIDNTIGDVDRKVMISDALHRLELRTIGLQLAEIKSKLANADEEQVDLLLRRQTELVSRKDELFKERMGS